MELDGIDNEEQGSTTTTTVAHRPRPVALAVAALAVVGLVGAVVAGSSSSDDPDPVSSAPVTEPTPSTIFDPVTDDDPTSSSTLADGRLDPDGLPVMADGRPPDVEGRLADGSSFRVFELSPGVLCAELDLAAGTGTADEICHHEHVTGSGGAVINGEFAFGYLRPRAESAMIRYRDGTVGNNGVRVERDARFFAIPIESSDAYRIRHVNGDLDPVHEEPLQPFPAGLSQSSDEAAAQGIPIDIADLPMIRRLEVLDEFTGQAGGPFATSRVPVRDRLRCQATAGGTSPPTEPPWCFGAFYEFLKLDDAGTSIEWAVPLPQLRPLDVLFDEQSPTAFVLARFEFGPEVPPADRPTFHGLVRIDTQTGDHRAVLLPNADGDDTDIDAAFLEDWLPSGWRVGPEIPPLSGSTGIGIDGDGRLVLWSDLDDVEIELDPTSLDVLAPAEI